jgi:prevent-host-death family protein
MERVGVRELKNRATQIVRAVREEHAEYLVTVDGEPVAVLRPCADADLQADRVAEYRAGLARLDAVAQMVGAHWQSEKGAVDLLMEMREEEDRAHWDRSA